MHVSEIGYSFYTIHTEEVKQLLNMTLQQPHTKLYYMVISNKILYDNFKILKIKKPFIGTGYRICGNNKISHRWNIIPMQHILKLKISKHIS